MTTNGKTPLLVSRQELVNSMLDYFKLRNQGYPPEMVQNLDKMWAEIFGDIKSAGLVVVSLEKVRQNAKTLSEIEDAWSTALPKARAEIVKMRWAQVDDLLKEAKQ